MFRWKLMQEGKQVWVCRWWERSVWEPQVYSTLMTGWKIENLCSCTRVSEVSYDVWNQDGEIPIPDKCGKSTNERESVLLFNHWSRKRSAGKFRMHMHILPNETLCHDQFIISPPPPNVASSPSSMEYSRKFLKMGSNGVSQTYCLTALEP